MAASLVPTEGGSPVVLDKPIVLIGRHQECDISLQGSSKVSRRHCCIVQVGERYVLRDLGSMNGIRVNGHRIVETELCPGDEVSVADVQFTFQRENGPARPRSQIVVRMNPPNGGGDFRVTPEADSLQTMQPDSSGADESPDIRMKDDSESEANFVRV